MQNLIPTMLPAPGERLQRFVGDRIRFTLADFAAKPIPKGWQARLRTNLGRAELVCKEIIQAHTRKLPPAAASWHDIPMNPDGLGWSLELPLTEIGYFKAKAYLIDPKGWQLWPEGPDIGISVHPDACRSGNTIYCAFTRMFGENKTAIHTANPKLDEQLKELDNKGYAVIPPSGKFRDLIHQLPHIIDTLGCRILHLLPVNPTPTTFARFGRFGSPYAALDLTAIDPALVEFDQRTTGIDQFCELAYATHLKGARVFLDIVINHTGWGSRLQEENPEWFLRNEKGSFVSPGAWGTIWEDLVELEHSHVALWDSIAESLLIWCRRGVDGFRCDAGYKVPLPAWQYITARVRQQFPETVFLLEGLGGAWELTDQLLAEGGMQWAYSELFQNYSPLQIAAYLDHSFKQSERIGLLVHYSETHDNERLAKRGRTWSLLRNQLCALTSMSGGFGFTCGVEWLAPEKINVHSNRGMAWGSSDNIIPELAKLNSTLLNHPCFFDGAKLTRLSPVDSPVYVLRRDSEEGRDSVLILLNTDPDQPQSVAVDAQTVHQIGELRFELVDGPLPQTRHKDGKLEFTIGPGGCHCLSPHPKPQGLSGEDYRQARAQAAWALTAMGRMVPVQQIPAIPWPDLARLVDQNPSTFLAAISTSDGRQLQKNLDALLTSGAKVEARFPPVVVWRVIDKKRILPIPPGHWLLVQDTIPFRVALHLHGTNETRHLQSIPVRAGHIACFPPIAFTGDARLTLERYALEDRQLEAAVRYLAAEPSLDSNSTRPLTISNLPELREVATTAREVKSEARAHQSLEQPLVLLTNGIGGMARMCVDLGAVKSKYDCVLGANLHPRVPVDRHIFAKRLRVWVVADGFISPLNLGNLLSFEPGPPAVWHFLANAGDGRTVEIQLTANMIQGCNTTVLHFDRPTLNLSKGKHLPDNCDVRLTVRLDIEDRNFHSETKRNDGADYHFSSNTRPTVEQIGFAFTPTIDRQLRVFADHGTYHHQPEWSENIPHPVEQSRGQVGSGDAFSPGWFELPLAHGNSVAMVVTADNVNPDAEQVSNTKVIGTTRKRIKSAATPKIFPENDLFGRQLVRAARQFVVRRDDSFTIIAGYPWFLDWGRDSLICARGLLAAGMVDEVKHLLITFGRFVNNGTLPNTIHGNDASNRDTSDAPLWYGVVCAEAAEILGDGLYALKVDQEDNTIHDVLTDIAMGYVAGTPNGIRMDPYSSLIWSPSHFTWMDTNYPAGTPREGYPVEIQVLWIRLLSLLKHTDGPAERKRWRELAEQARISFQKYFWLEDRGYFADLLVAGKNIPASDALVDNALRSNCLLAISLGLVTGEPARRCVDAALHHLVVPGALRTLAPMPVAPPLPIHGCNGQLLNNPNEPYYGHYEGDEDTRRKAAYHNGTAWTWTFPIFCEALARAWNNSPEALAVAKAYLGSMDRLIMEGCIGQIPEIVDGDAPHIQRGCDAQAWGVTEALRVWKFLHHPKDFVIV
ncbi:amylo-alpha-1,6-glucosidase [Pedosphaera parvula]|uniref:Amylo-alpha-16-glucosidase n=1 Tax=Pedosphaera parvula (strain Ellin514) TaxID=320771 RepID=B9XRT5_PEDPL|nr:amylo-alpha-1,6-glucosidase [Pedosphaera parvula]EEF57446.1 Amylo-alpha-16-glucosidase [Pedosphaera parvula Ellin514]